MISNQLNYRNTLLLFISVLIVSSQAQAQNKTNIPKPDHSHNLLYTGFTAKYDVSKNDMQLGESERQLIRHSDAKFTYTSLTYATGIASWFFKDKITESSQYQLRNNMVIPTRYDYKNTNGKPNDNFSIIFNNKKNFLTRTKDNIKHELAHNKQDVLSFQVAIMLAMQQNNKNIKFTIVDNESIDEYSLVHTQNEELETDRGYIKTQVMESKSQNNKDRYIFWTAKKYNFLPIKVKRIEPNGDELLIKLNRINGQKLIIYEPSEEDEDY